MIIHSYTNFLEKKELQHCLKWYDYIEENNLWASSLPFWDGRTYDVSQLLDLKHRDSYFIFMKILKKIKNFIYENIDNSVEMFPDSIQIIKWKEGQQVHADNVDMDGTPSIASWRVYSSIIYLNNDFIGGQTFFPNYNYEIDPEPGKLAVFSCNLEHAHGIREIEGGVRKTVASFWSGENINKNIRIS